MRTHVCLVIDRSGSMITTLADAQGGLDSFVSTMDLPGVTLALWEFDNVVGQAVPPVAAAAWPGYRLTPRGMTALLDAMGRAITETRAHLDVEPADRVVVVVVTDGGENASREYTAASVEAMVTKAKADGWEFIFLASDLSAARTATSVGIAPTRFTPTGTSSAYGAMTRSVSAYASGLTTSVAMGDEA